MVHAMLLQLSKIALKDKTDNTELKPNKDSKLDLSEDLELTSLLHQALRHTESCAQSLLPARPKSVLPTLSSQTSPQSPTKLRSRKTFPRDPTNLKPARLLKESSPLVERLP